MAEYIDRKKVIKRFEEIRENIDISLRDALYLNGVMAVIDSIPAADVAEVKHGKWIGWHGDKLVGIDDNGDDMYRHYHYNTCSECGRGNAIKSAYCPHCGAKMDLE